ncbi:MAG: hypothetical protein IKE69_02590 [Thermoguttaceae bacterium]|nr:hypothetical protein [Thermoguttaceae bacterium]
MGGNGTYSIGHSPEYTYETVGKIDGVKILKPKDPRKQFKLPEESHSPNARYVLLDKDGVFHQYREYNENHQVVLGIGYHHEPSLGKGDVLHVHIDTIPGVEWHTDAQKYAIGPGDQYYEKYKQFFKGVK